MMTTDLESVIAETQHAGGEVNIKSLYKITGKGYEEFWHTRKFYRVVKGSRGSKKSMTTALWYIYHMMKYPLANTVVIRRYYSDHVNTTYATLQKAIELLGLEDYWEAKIDPLRLIIKDTKQTIWFRGMDDPGKVASFDAPHGYLCWFWFEEAYQIMNYEDYERADMSLRGALPADSGLWKQITITFNPWSDQHWLKARFFDHPADNVLSMTTTYLCNEFLDEEDIRRYEDMKIRAPHLYRVQGLGEWGVSEGLIYSNWKAEEFDLDSLRQQYDLRFSYGLDFGYGTSYNAFVAIAVDIKERKLWIFDEMYNNHRTNDAIAKEIINMGYGKERIIADSANPLNIAELKAGALEYVKDEHGNQVYIEDDNGTQVAMTARYSLPQIYPATKGADSVINGIQRLQGYEIIVHPKCYEIIKEFSLYAWKKDRRTGKQVFPATPDKEAGMDHGMDALRYAFEKFFPRASGKIVEARGIDGQYLPSPLKSKRVFRA